MLSTEKRANFGAAAASAVPSATLTHSLKGKTPVAIPRRVGETKQQRTVSKLIPMNGHSIWRPKPVFGVRAWNLPLRSPAISALILTISLTLSAQQWSAVTPDEAESHLLKKVEPVYPPFARAAGIEGTVQLHVGIYTDGRIHSISGAAEAGSPDLWKAAQKSVSGYVYSPFIKDGKPVNVTTTISVEFKLPAGKPKPWPVPNISFSSFDGIGDSVKIPAPSPAMEEWLEKNAARHTEDCSEYVDPADNAANESKEQTHARLLKRLRDHTSLVDIDDRPGSYRLYLVSIEDRCICGATGNCSIDIVEVEPGRIRIVGSASGWGYALVHREGPLGLPDVFLIENTSAADSVVAGFANLGGEWGQLYCGAGENDHLDIKQCR
jgi:TonB family protein